MMVANPGSGSSRSKYNDVVKPIGDVDRRPELQRIYDRNSALVHNAIHAMVDAFMPKDCFIHWSSFDTQGERNWRRRSFRRIPRAIWGRGHEAVPLWSHVPSLLLKKRKLNTSWWWLVLIKKKKLKSSRLRLLEKKEKLKSSWHLLVLMSKLKSKCLMSATCKLGTKSWSVWHMRTTA